MNADIAMCNNQICKLAESCERSPKSGTVPTEYQVWAEFPKKSPCAFFIAKGESNKAWAD